MKDDKFLAYLIIGIISLLIAIVAIIPWIIFGNTDQSFPPKPPIPGLQRSPVIDRLAP